MSTQLTAIILDGHPAAFGPTTRDHDPTIDQTQMLPPIPWWTCMVDSTLEFCRIGWDTALSELPEIAVIAAGERSRYLISPGEGGQTDKLVEEFKHVQPRQTYPHDRIQAALNTLLSNPQTQSFRSIRIILVLLSKNSKESKYSHHNNEDSKWRDVRAMVHTASQAACNVDSIHTDVLRLFPRRDNLLPSINNVSYAAGGTLSVHNIPNHQDALKSTMRHLAQLYYNIDVLRISNIPMSVHRADGSTAMTQTVDLYAQCSDGCNQDTPADTNVPIYDPRYLQSKVVQLSYVKRNKRVSHDMGWCACRHVITPVIDDGPTKAYLGTMRNGSVSYLVNFERKGEKEWTHTLLADHDRVFLHVLDDRLEEALAEKLQTIIDKSKVKSETPAFVGPSPTITPDKVQEFLQCFVHPNGNANISHIAPTNTYNPFEYSSAAPLLALSSSNQATPTTFNIEHSTRWHTCFRDCMGTDKFPVTLADSRPICDLAAEVCNGSPLHSGFSVLSMLSVSLSASLAKIRSALLTNEVPNLKAVTAEVDIVVNHLSSVLLGKSTKPICNMKTLREDSQLMAKRLLIALYLVGKRFFTFRSAICDYILQTINDKTATRAEVEPTSSNETKEPTSIIDSAWNQAKKFEGMTVREQEDSRYTLGTGIATASVKEETTMPRQRRGRGGRGNVSINPNFRRDGGESVSSRKRPADASVAVPYILAEVANDQPRQVQQQQQEQFGPPDSLLHLYWTVDKRLREGKGADSDGKVLVFRNNKWQRIQKEFDGRMSHKN